MLPKSRKKGHMWRLKNLNLQVTKDMIESENDLTKVMPTPWPKKCMIQMFLNSDTGNTHMSSVTGGGVKQKIFRQVISKCYLQQIVKLFHMKIRTSIDGGVIIVECRPGLDVNHSAAWSGTN